MKCPYCGKEIIKSSINYTGMLQTLIMDRLTEYGYEEKNPKNGDFIHRSRLLLQLLLPNESWNKGNRIISEELNYKAEQKLNEISPHKGVRTA